jgi:O-antigen/teichoic acid export membrane protein
MPTFTLVPCVLPFSGQESARGNVRRWKPPTMNIKAAVLKNLSFSGLTASTHVLMFLTLILGARHLGHHDFGVFSFAYAFSEITNVIFDFGFYPYLIRTIARDKSRSEHVLGNILSLRTISYLASAIAVFPILFFTDASPIVFVIIYITMAQFFLKGYQMLFRGMFVANNLFHYESASVAIDRVSTLVLCTAVLALGGGIVSFASMILAGKLISILYLMWKLGSLGAGPARLRFDVQEWPSLLRSSIPFALSIVFGEIYFKVDSVMLGYLRSAAEVGLYSAAYNLFEGLTTVALVVSSSIYPLVSKYHVEDSEMVKIMFSNAFKALLMICIPVLLIGFFFSKDIIYLVYGNEYVNSAPALQVLLFAFVFVSVGMLCLHVLAGINRERIIVAATGMGALINVAANALVIPYYGAKGAALTTVLTELLVLMIMLYYLKDRIVIRFSDIVFMAKVALTSLATLTLGMGLSEHLHIVGLLAGLGAFYIALLYLMKAHTAFLAYETGGTLPKPISEKYTKA